MSFVIKSHSKEQLFGEIARRTGEPVGEVPRSYLFESRFAIHRLERSQVGYEIDGELHFHFISNLQFLLGNVNKRQCKRLFPGPFDLGGDTPASDPTKEALMIEMQKLGFKSATVEGFRTAKEQIAKFTGHHFDTHLRNAPLKTLKVLKTIMELKEHSFRHVYKFLTPPKHGDAGSFEVVESHPLQDDAAVERVAFLADLKAHLALEIPLERRQEIDNLYGPIRDAGQTVVAELQKVAKKYAGDNCALFELHLREALKTLSELPVPEFNSQPLLPLDEAMYIHCSSLEFLNYAVAQRPIYFDYSPNIKVKRFGLQIEGLPDFGDGPQLRIEEFPKFAKNNETMLLSAIEQTLGYKPDAMFFDKAVELALTVLRMSKAFEPQQGAFALVHGFWTNPFSCVAALTAVYHQKHNPTKGFKPNWHGRKNISDNVLSALEAIKLSPNPRDNYVPEGFSRFWGHQFKWFSHALVDGLDIYLLKLEVNQAVLDRLEPFLRHHDTKVLAQRQAEIRALPAALETKLQAAQKPPAQKPDYRSKPWYRESETRRTV